MMVPFLRPMLVATASFVGGAIAMVVWPGGRWLWWAASAGLGLVLMGWAGTG